MQAELQRSRAATAVRINALIQVEALQLQLNWQANPETIKR